MGQIADILEARGELEEALVMLDAAETGFRKLVHAKGLERAARLREAIAPPVYPGRAKSRRRSADLQ